MKVWLQLEHMVYLFNLSFCNCLPISWWAHITHFHPKKQYSQIKSDR
uniref:Uncharacterized protein n=1 Tax=Arundo donax TaxID=35708 RepID=A0A0A9F5J6_ARUDO